MPNQYSNKSELLTEDEKREHQRLNMARWRAKNPHKKKDYKRIWIQRNPERHRIGHRQRVWRNQGVKCTWTQYLLMLETQKYCCKVCGIDINTSSPVDHNHITGEVRGVLCDRCNRAIGLWHDNADILGKAYQYLREYET